MFLFTLIDLKSFMHIPTLQKIKASNQFKFKTEIIWLRGFG
jgi:hypothetical protein